MWTVFCGFVEGEGEWEGRWVGEWKVRDGAGRTAFVFFFLSCLPGYSVFCLIHRSALGGSTFTLWSCGDMIWDVGWEGRIGGRGMGYREIRRSGDRLEDLEATRDHLLWLAPKKTQDKNRRRFWLFFCVLSGPYCCCVEKVWCVLYVRMRGSRVNLVALL